MANQLDRLYYGAKGVMYNKLHFDIFKHKFVKRYAGVKIVEPSEMNTIIKSEIMGGRPFMAGRFGGFEVFAMQSAEGQLSADRGKDEARDRLSRQERRLLSEG